MNYEEAVAYIEETPKFTKKNSLDHTRECLRRLGNPEKKFKVIHVAGTNGKGSTCAFLTSILREAGYSCGLFTSPHLVRINERFQINEINIDDDTFLAAFEKVKALADELVAEGSYHPTYFEMLFLMGMVIFADAGVDYVTLETGLGGRLDATTAVEDPVACVITSISLDHMQYLGDTVSKIAGEKAGIIVPNVPVIYDGNDPDAAKVIEKRAKELGSPAYKVVQSDARVLGNNKDGIDFSLKDEYYGDTSFHIPFIAWYQVMNASLSLTTMEVLRNVIPVTMEQMQEGIKNTRWQGRMETILPGVIVDGAHNEDGVRRFVETAERFQDEYPLTLLFSAVNDKDYQDMIHTICQKIRFRKVVTTEVGGYREVPSAELAEIFQKEGCKDVANSDSIQEAFYMASEAKGEDGMLFCVGSLYLVGEIKALLSE
ncbi:MAG: folylpolyglutamate synthase/dihydrofolate synthase family protein [Blautia sp.]